MDGPDRVGPRASSAGQVATATEAARRWIVGAATGDWAPFVAMLAADVRFTVPVPGFVPGGVGRDAAQRFFAFLTGNLRTTLVVKRVLAGGEHVGFEIRAEGHIDGRAIANHLLLVLTVRDAEVVAFREYLAWPDGVGDVSTGRDLLN